MKDKRKVQFGLALWSVSEIVEEAMDHTTLPVEAAVQRFVDEDDYSSSEDEEFNEFLTPADAPLQFTYNPLPNKATMSPADRKAMVTSIVFDYGVSPRKDANVRFVVGMRENNRPPARGKREIDTFKRRWDELKRFSRTVNWRRIMCHDFDQDRRHKSMSFLIDGLEWTSVTHFLLGMLYRGDPKYALRYSSSNNKDPNGFWGNTESAKREHLNNIKFGESQPDLNFDQVIEGFLQKALAAKFTQNPDAKRALLLTEDAIISVRGGPDGILDVPVFEQIRNWIKQNPKAVYKGDSVALEQEVEEVPMLDTLERMNYGYLTPEQKTRTVGVIAGSIQTKDLYSVQIQPITSQTEEITNTECYVYLYVGAIHYNIEAFISAFGNPVFVRRHIYALEQIANDGHHIIIGIQRTPTSFKRSYFLFSLTIDSLQVGLYVEPFTTGCGLFMLSSDSNQQILDTMNQIVDGKFVNPPGRIISALPEVKVIPLARGQLGRNKMTRQFVALGDLDRLYFRAKAIREFAENGLAPGQLGPATSEEDQGVLYDLFDALEKLLVSLADLNGEDLFADNATSPFVYDQFNRDIKDISDVIDSAKLIEVLKEKIREADQMALDESKAPNRIRYLPQFVGRYLSYRDFQTSRADPQRVELFRTILVESKAILEIPEDGRPDWIALAMARVFLADSMLLPHSQKWSTPLSFARCLHEKFKVDLEVFGSPLSAALLDYDVPYCSVFDQIDSPLGSLGNVFRLDFSKFLGNRKELFLLVHPPSITYIINDTCDLLEQWYRICAEPPHGLGVKLTVVMISKTEPDSYYDLWLKKFPMVRINLNRQARSYLFDDLANETTLPVPYDTILSVMSNKSESLNTAFLNQCFRLMNSK